MSPVFTLPLFLFQPFAQTFSQVIFFLFNSRGSLCTNVKLIDTVSISKAKANCICSYCLGPAGKQGWALWTPRGDRWGAPFWNEGQRTLWGGGLEGTVGKDQAEVPSSSISQLKFEVTFLPPERVSSLSCFLQVQSLHPPCQLLLLCQAEAFGGWVRVLRCSGHRCNLFLCDQVEPTTQMVQRMLCLLLMGLLTSAGRCHQQSHRAGGAGSGGSATGTP